MIRHRQADHVLGKLEILRLHERRDLDLDAGLAVVVALQRQHDRRLFRSPVANIAAEIGDGAVRKVWSGLAFGQRAAISAADKAVQPAATRPCWKRSRLASIVAAVSATQIGPPVVEHDVGRILRKRHVVVEPVGAVITRRIDPACPGPARTSRQTLLSLLERHRVARRIRVDEFLPAVRRPAACASRRS